MEPTKSTLQSKRAREIIVEAQEGDAPLEGALVSRAAVRVQAIKNIRDQFDDESPKVGLRDSTWLLVSAVALLAIAFTWGHPVGLDLFARLMVIGGGVAIAVAVIGRNLLAK
jgi:hypothetical protein